MKPLMLLAAATLLAVPAAFSQEQTPTPEISGAFAANHEFQIFINEDCHVDGCRYYRTYETGASVTEDFLNYIEDPEVLEVEEWTWGEPIVVAQPTVIKAIAVEEGKTASAIASAFFSEKQVGVQAIVNEAENAGIFTLSGLPVSGALQPGEIYLLRTSNGKTKRLIIRR